VVRGLLALVGATAIAGAGILALNAGALGGLRGVGYEAPAGMALLGPLMAPTTAARVLPDQLSILVAPSYTLPLG
jgi:hypothetical protein